MANHHFAGWQERGSSANRGGRCVRVNCVQSSEPRGCGEAKQAPEKKKALENLERAKGFEPSPQTLARLCSAR